MALWVSLAEEWGSALLGGPRGSSSAQGSGHPDLRLLYSDHIPAPATPRAVLC